MIPHCSLVGPKLLASQLGEDSSLADTICPAPTSWGHPSPLPKDSTLLPSSSYSRCSGSMVSLRDMPGDTGCPIETPSTKHSPSHQQSL